MNGCVVEWNVGLQCRPHSANIVCWRFSSSTHYTFSRRLNSTRTRLCYIQHLMSTWLKAVPDSLSFDSHSHTAIERSQHSLLDSA